jgi:DNA-binding CsgD family transcriptional regulator
MNNNQQQPTKNIIEATPIEDALDQLNTFADFSATNVITTENFQSFIRSVVRPILPHQKLLCGCGQILVDQLHVKYMIGVDYVESHIQQIQQDFNLSERPVMANWLLTRQPVFIHAIRDQHLLSPLEKREVIEFELGSFAAHGHIDMSGQMATYFSFAGVEDYPEFYIKRLRMLAPFLHAALVKLDEHLNTQQAIHFSDKEKEIIYWLMIGKHNNEIAMILGKSTNTVRNQVQQIFIKLGVNNRQGAMMKIQELQIV